jgi:hypothetical protein
MRRLLRRYIVVQEHVRRIVAQRKIRDARYGGACENGKRNRDAVRADKQQNILYAFHTITPWVRDPE